MKIGDRVKICPDSEWYSPKEGYLKASNPINVLGVVTDIQPGCPDALCIDVTWDATYENGKPIVNTYAKHDLEVVV